MTRLVLTNCDTHENFPPGVFKLMPPLAKLPGGMRVLAAPFRIPVVARLAFSPFAKTGPSAELVAGWTAPAIADKAIMRDLAKVTVGLNKRYTLAAAAALRGSRFPLLLAWAPGDRFFPIAGAERLAAEIGGAQLVEIPDSGTFTPLDQPKYWPRISPTLRPRNSALTNNRSQNPQSGTFSSDWGVNLYQTPDQDGNPCPSRSSTRTGPAARWPDCSTKPSPAATSGPSHPRLSVEARST